MYHGYHSIDIYLTKTFDLDTENKKNTFEDFHLVAETRPHVAPPEPKYELVDVPGRNGSVDYTNALNDRISYNNRTGSWEFIIVNDFFEPVSTHKEWYDTYTEIMKFIQGKKLYLVLEDDRSFFYEGRLHVSDFESERNYSKITITYTLSPFKYSIFSTLTANKWLWDPFNFYTGIIPKLKYYKVLVPSWDKDGLGKYVGDHIVATRVQAEDVGSAAACPTIYGDAYMDPRAGVIYNNVRHPSLSFYKSSGSSSYIKREFTYLQLRKGVKAPELTFWDDPYNTEGEQSVGSICACTKLTRSVPWGLFKNENAPWDYTECEECGQSFERRIVEHKHIYTVTTDDQVFGPLHINCQICHHQKTFNYDCKCEVCGTNFATEIQGGFKYNLDFITDYYMVECPNCHNKFGRPYAPDVGEVSYDFRKGEF